MDSASTSSQALTDLGSARVFEQVRRIFRKCLDQPFSDFSRSLTPKDIRRWDSMKNVEILLRIEEVFSLEFDPAELSKMQSVGAICDVIERKHKASSKSDK